MGCPGGCVNGGGQSIVNSNIRNKYPDLEWVKLRAKALYQEDINQTVRQSHNNTQIQELYDKFLEQPGSHIAHQLLHTTYSQKARFK